MDMQESNTEKLLQPKGILLSVSHSLEVRIIFSKAFLHTAIIWGFSWSRCHTFALLPVTFNTMDLKYTLNLYIMSLYQVYA